MATMESLIANYRAVVVGATGGVGAALVSHLERDPRCAGVEAFSRATGFDLTDEASVARAAERLSGGEVDLIVVATGALSSGQDQPEKTIRHLAPDAMLRQFAVNAVGPALVLKHFAPLLPRGRRALFAVLSARIGSIGDNRLGGWISHRASKAALNQIVRTAAIEIARTRPDAVVCSIHPGTVATRFSERFAEGRERLPPPESAARILSVLDRLAPADTGSFLAHDGTTIAW